MIKLFKFIALLFPCLSLTACTFDDIPQPLIYDNHQQVKSIINDDYISSFLDTYENKNYVTIAKDNALTFTYSLYNFFDFYQSLSGGSTYGYDYAYYRVGDTYTLLHNIFIQFNSEGVFYYFHNGWTEGCYFYTYYDQSRTTFSWYNLDDSAVFYLKLNTYWNFALNFLDYLRYQDALENPYDISNYGFVENGFYCFDYLKFQQGYASLVTDYSLASITSYYYDSNATYTSFTETMGASNSLYYTSEGNSYVSLNFPFQEGTSTFTPYLFFPISANNYLPSFESYTADNFPLDKFNYGLSDYSLACLSFSSALGLIMYRDYSHSSDISINADNNYSNQYSYSYTGTQSFYIYFVCDKPFVMNSLYYHKTNVNYITNYVPINRYIDSMDNVFISKLYQVYIDSFTYLADFTGFMTSSNQYNSYIVGCYANTSTYFEDNPPTYYQVNMSDLSSLTIRKNDEGKLRFVDSATGNLYKYLVLMIYDRRDRSLTPYFNGANPNQIYIRSINRNTWGVGIGNHLYLGLNAEKSATAPNCMFTIYNAFDNGYNYSKTYDIVGGAEAVYIPVSSSTFYQYMFGILDTPLYMVSQTFVVPFDFNILALLLALVGLSIAMFILRLII